MTEAQYRAPLEGIATKARPVVGQGRAATAVGFLASDEVNPLDGEPVRGWFTTRIGLPVF